VVEVLVVLEERLQCWRWRLRGMDLRLTTKHGGGAVVVVIVGCAIAWNATDAS